MLSMLTPIPLAPMRMMDAVLADAIAIDARLSCRAPSALRPTMRHTVVESDDGMSYNISLQAPGISPSDMKVDVHEDGARITLRGVTKNVGILRRLDYSLHLPHDANASEATATAADGLITVSVPKVIEQGPMKITVNAEATPVEGDDDDHYTLTVVAAGIAPSDLELSVESNMLKVSGKSKRTGSSLERAYKIPRNADVRKAHASHIDGILTVTVPKKANEEAKRIEVNKPQPAADLDTTMDNEEATEVEAMKSDDMHKEDTTDEDAVVV